MSYKLFKTTDRNPNDAVGGGGCVCSPTKERDCTGPYAVFYGNDMESPISPHVVIGLACAQAVVEALTDGEVGRASEATILPEPVAEQVRAHFTEDDEDLPEV